MDSGRTETTRREPGRAPGRGRAPGAGLTSWVARARALVVALARLVVPVLCPGCGRWDEVLCAGCRAALEGGVRRVERGAARLDTAGPPVPVWSQAAYAGAAREVLLAWKEHGRTDLSGPLGDVLAGTARAAARAVSTAAVRAGGPPCGSAELLVVPVPSSPAASRRRGEDLVAGLAARVASEVTAAGMRGRCVRVLVRRPGGRDQVGLGARARGRNSAGRARLSRRGRRTGLDGALVLLVDDILTTGATMRGCVRALEQAGGCVVGAVVLAATPAPAGEDATAGSPDARDHPSPTPSGRSQTREDGSDGDHRPWH